MKTPEEMAEEYIEQEQLEYDEAGGAYYGFLAGYQAAKDQLTDADKVMNSSNNSNGWISVKERLPKEGMEVVIGWFQQTASNKLYWTTDVAILTNKAFSGWRVYPEVTHWMPLPAAPKEEA